MQSSHDDTDENNLHELDVDISLIEFNLSLTYEERLNNHQKAFEIIQEILLARKVLYGEFEQSPQETS